MNTKRLPLFIGLGVLGIFILWAISSYNGMVSKQLVVDQKWADVQSAYQRRLDLIPNLVSTVKGYADFEKSTLTAVTEARAKATSINISADNLTEENMKKFQQVQSGLAGALKSLLAVSENYPDLKANTNFLELQTELSRTENRINVSRNDFNAAVTEYNGSVMRFPGNIVAGLFGFKAKAPFAADAGAEKAPTVKF
jgi:LemA protein